MKKIIKNKYFPFFLLFLILLILHVFMNFGGDDLWFGKQLEKLSLPSYLQMRYQTWSSRVIIESILVFITKFDIFIWRILDCLLYTLACFVSVKLVNRKGKREINYLGCCLFLIYPYYEMSSAGWGATTLNYMWCFSFGMLSFLPLIYKEYSKKIPKWLYVIAGVGLLYATNQEQMCALVLGFNFLYFIRKAYRKEKLNSYNVICLGLSLISLIFILTCPGNNIRTLSEITKWYPAFADFNLLHKVYLGVVPTMGVLLNNKVVLGVTFMLLSLGTFLYGKKSITKGLAIFNFSLILGLTFFEVNLIQVFPFLKNIISIFQYQGIPSFDKVSVFAFIFSIVLVIDMVFMLLVIFKGKQWLPIFVLLAGFASRFLIGFSPTIFVSGARTAFFLYMSLLIVGMFVLVKMYEDKKISQNYNLLLKSILTLLAFAVLINTFVYI